MFWLAIYLTYIVVLEFLIFRLASIIFIFYDFETSIILKLFLYIGCVARSGNQRIQVFCDVLLYHKQRRKGPVIKYLLWWAGGKIESFSKSLMAQLERNKKFLWPTSMAEKFFMAHPCVVKLVTKGY